MSTPLQVPNSYADWVSCFKILMQADRDEELLDVIAKGKVPWQKGIADRFVTKMRTAISFRLQHAVDTFIKQLNHLQIDENSFVLMLLSLRKQGQYLLRFVNVPVFPEELRKKFTSEIEKSLDDLQVRLKNEVKAIYNGRFIPIVQHTPILVHEQIMDQEVSIPSHKQIKRRIILE